MLLFSAYFSPNYRRIPNVGETEQGQLLRYIFASGKKKRYLSLLSFNHCFDVTVENLHCQISIRLNDCRNVTVNFGGATFRTISSNIHRLYACPYIDYSNGTYEILCNIYDQYTNVTITLTYLDFSAYRWDGRFINKTIWEDSIYTTDTSNCKLNRHQYIGWFRKNVIEDWVWIHPHEFMLTADAIKTCTKNYLLSINFFGDSHLFYVLLYVLQVINKLLPITATKQNLEEHFLNFNFWRTSYVLTELQIPDFELDRWATLPRHKSKVTNKTSYSLKMAMQEWLANQKKILQSENILNTSYVIVLQFGTWDLAFRNIKYFIFHTIPTIRRLLEAIKSDALLSKSKVVIWGPPAFREYDGDFDQVNPVLRLDLRNNALIAAANAMIRDVAASLHSTVFVDYYTQTFCRIHETIDRTHYLWANVRNNSISMEGAVGIVSAKLLLRHVCL